MTTDVDGKEGGNSATSNERAEHLSTPPQPFEDIAPVARFLVGQSRLAISPSSALRTLSLVTWCSRAHTPPSLEDSVPPYASIHEVIRCLREDGRAREPGGRCRIAIGILGQRATPKRGRQGSHIQRGRVHPRLRLSVRQHSPIGTRKAHRA
jgi:hypothetical protein